MHNISSINKHQNYYFVAIWCLWNHWNDLPIVNLNLSVHSIKKHTCS